MTRLVSFLLLRLGITHLTFPENELRPNQDCESTTLGRANRSLVVFFINSFVVGTASGLRALMGLAAASWAARLGVLPLDHTWLAFLG